ncbi:MAG: hypothetical protein H0W36_00590 [Gemmatimonadetes bacterium]|nr:hypothetical protein [Gemmatimonadota bacterium]
MRLTALLAVLLLATPPLPTVRTGGIPERINPMSATSVRGTATWYCGAGSRCTRGYGPSDLVAAIDPTTGIVRGTRLTVTSGGRSVSVRVVDVCACRGERVIDLTTGAFRRLAPLSRGVIPVTIRIGGPRPTLPPTDVAP